MRLKAELEIAPEPGSELYPVLETFNASVVLGKGWKIDQPCQLKSFCSVGKCCGKCYSEFFPPKISFRKMAIGKTERGKGKTTSRRPLLTVGLCEPPANLQSKALHT